MDIESIRGQKPGHYGPCVVALDRWNAPNNRRHILVTNAERVSGGLMKFQLQGVSRVRGVRRCEIPRDHNRLAHLPGSDRRRAGDVVLAREASSGEEDRQKQNRFQGMHAGVGDHLVNRGFVFRGKGIHYQEQLSAGSLGEIAGLMGKDRIKERTCQA